MMMSSAMKKHGFNKPLRNSTRAIQGALGSDALAAQKSLRRQKLQAFKNTVRQDKGYQMGRALSAGGGYGKAMMLGAGVGMGVTAFGTGRRATGI